MSFQGETRRIVVAPVGEMVAAFCLALVRGASNGVKIAGTMARRFENRRVLGELAGLDDRMLRDIGLTRADLRDASAAPFVGDPTRVLVLRATERRAAARLLARAPREN
ncbi:DUF1127 domain-containing protein [Xanthobacter autotrophicus DSM 431]|uniref:DUF1127 domain-containing protein n=1 Tax=Xanthobacter nonsaccharivorans TaxID=3119912 RepID=UPI0037283297